MYSFDFICWVHLQFACHLLPADTNLLCIIIILQLLNWYTHIHSTLPIWCHGNKPKAIFRSSPGWHFWQSLSETSHRLSKGKQAEWCSLTSTKVIRIVLLGSLFNPNWQVISCLGINNIQHTVYLWIRLSSPCLFHCRW